MQTLPRDRLCDRGRRGVTSETVKCLLGLILGLSTVSMGACLSAGPRTLGSEASTAFTEGARLHQKGRHDEAALAFDRAAEADPLDLDAWLAAARAHAGVLHVVDAKRCLERAPALDGKAPRVLDATVEVLIALNLGEEARDHLRAALEAAPPDAAGLVKLGDLEATLGELDDALATYERAVQLDPKLSAAHERLGHLHARAGRTAAAAKALNRAVINDATRRALDPVIVRLAVEGDELEVARTALGRMKIGNEPEAASLALGALLAERDNLLAAVGEFERVLKRLPDHAEARLALGQLLARAGRYDDAEATLARLKPDAPRPEEALGLRGELALRRSDPESALLHATELTRLRPDEAHPIVLRVRALRALKRHAEVTPLLDAGRKRFPANDHLAFLEALNADDLGDEARAVRLMETLIVQAPRHAAALNFVGFSLAERGVRLDEAETLIRRAMEQEPDDGAITDSLGWVLYQRGRLADAEVQLRRATELDPDEAEIRFHLGEVLFVSGQREAGLALMKSATSATKDNAFRARWTGRLKQLRQKRKP